MARSRFVQLTAQDLYMLRSIDTDANTVAAELRYRDDNVVADDDSFAYFSGENKHGDILHDFGCVTFE